ncbi:hypothetical protein [Ferrovum myxofaciens]|uniref:Uncharacterized protein n=1 Tax=Ferrovum myxofaciens TaxID=416213 RepID=A0A9E6MWL7_9PROT|nr:hypothetical protein [Ferrovum myxofaciens]QKE37349.1 MAG: hypothetical protein HO273_00265 [Ferrovum myxofaciens]QWY75005.1 MAG: hypothetical protein JVY19_00740 [Ferrovum myxofaciens]QWY77746.1 MAG: hypothetical protein JZL65_01270 [Ferrovum myxofaciens]
MTKITMENTDQFVQKVAAMLAGSGYQVVPKRFEMYGALLTTEREVETAVGAKKSVVYLFESISNQSDVMLGGIYYSEGRNVLESCSIFFRHDEDLNLPMSKGRGF